ncbi:hypothetical protein MJO28_013769 [Puccinia striiformis f. sp. tritici]|uniref:Uncharacterized protein n=2 Tax=Puccinia striiformis f. sp. tritici TaxID=168172 RepID=A0A0L0V0F5_9BASI|nr:uncharacterized protein Pst134EA_031897 [Puccinia striiformis f. sp. tritici]XP_047800041.1 hypothetical protein Pst134EA_025688 [Puccinia striiformis f. sp. tritici]KAI9628364.1 hypothetical protein KEM48_011647 [Puccinia striiformis f. sp. tritici PST-130]KNE92772.1 hypothetical protein PSTG_13829 [Puccinia striiformis f. sp. tritici PST-78]KAH9442575.1 hypothetical protein Pst134EA_031897 [Puccinia striiformis f. sp. tritici]KAH9443919.1 hypothetical protein Pst134EB_026308 [Puccinia str
MVHLSTRLIILSSIFLLVQLTYLTAANKGHQHQNHDDQKGQTCCPGDSKCSGCWMCPTSQLRECWDAAVDDIDKCHITDDLKKSAHTFCKGFAKLAKCWTTGRCCSEYAPLLAAATNLCNLKTWSPHLITREQLEKFVVIANDTRSAIWHNDSGKNVPKLTVTVKAYSSDSSESTESYSYNPQTNTHTSKSTQSSKSTSTVSTSSYSKKPTEKNNEAEDEEDTDTKEDAKHSTDYGKKATLNLKQAHSFQPQLHHQDSGAKKHTETETHSGIIRHQAKCAVKEVKCQSKNADSYHKDRWSHTKKSLAKRVEKPLQKRATYHHSNAELFKRTEENDHGCGLDFQGVQYPKTVPETVAHVYAEL